MTYTTKITAGVILAVMIAAAALIAVPAAQAQDPTPEPPTGGYGPWNCPMGGPNSGFMYQMRTQMHAALAGALGMTVDELNAAMLEGKTPWQIAEEKGIDPQTLSDVMQAAREAAIQQGVEDGVLTQEQADWMLNHMKNTPYGQGFGPWGGMMGGGWRGGRGGMMGGRGMMGGWWGNQNQTPVTPQWGPQGFGAGITVSF